MISTMSAVRETEEVCWLRSEGFPIQRIIIVEERMDGG